MTRLLPLIISEIKVASSLDKIKSILSALPKNDREELFDHLLSTLDPDDDVRADWLCVAEQRIAEIRSGQAEGIPADEALQNLLELEK
ncbi:MAG TPA: addiction module protein [Gemmataceae bacterium]|nr:addiction module protein [Gemmataceae bacterium]